MTQQHPTPVTVVGLGAMGAALAEAFIAAGHPTTVWNRTAEKADPLVARGGSAAETVADAVAASPLVIACLTTYTATREVLDTAGDALTGRTLVTLNTGTPSGAAEMAAWAGERGVRFLDGAVKNVPEAVGRPDTLLYYSGDRTVFDEYQETLRVLGGDTVHLGEEPDLAALYELAVGSTLLPALLGFLQGAAYVTARGFQAGTLVRDAQKWLGMIAAILPELAEEVDSGDYTEPSSALGNFRVAVEEEHQYARTLGVDVAWQRPMLDLLDRAIADGHAEHSIAALVEPLRNPPGNPPSDPPGDPRPS